MWHPCNLAAKESGLECACVNNDFTGLVSGGSRQHWVSVCTVWLSHSKGLSKKSNKFCVKLEHSSMEIFWMIQKATAVGNWWLTASSWQCTRSCITSPTELFDETSNHPRDFDVLWLLAFSKTKITFGREEISDHWWDSGKYDEAAVATGRIVCGPMVPTLKGTEASLSCVQCFLYLLQ